MTDSRLVFTEGDAEKSLRWQSEAGSPPPKLAWAPNGNAGPSAMVSKHWPGVTSAANVANAATSHRAARAARRPG